MTIETTRTRKYLGLQILRIIAACMVLVTHATLYTHERLDNQFRVWEAGALGVDIFFVLSGFVMVYSSTKLLKPNGWKIFAERRIVRIVPMYWIATSIKAIALLLPAGYVLHEQFNVIRVLESYFFVPAYNNLGYIQPILPVGWTLNFEMFFYLLFTLALLFRANIFGFVGGILALLALGAFIREPNWPAVSFYLNTMVLQFFYGMVIAKICLAGKHIPKYLAITLLGLGFFSLIASWPNPQVLRGLPHGLAAALIVYSMASLEDWLTQIPWIVLYAADASYVIYLFHPLYMQVVPALLMKYHLPYPWISVACCITLGIAGGCLIHRYIEAPITNWLRDHLPIAGKKVIHKQM